jgi:CBS domain-containing protein
MLCVSLTKWRRIDPEEARKESTSETIPAYTSYPVISSDGSVIGMASRADIFRWTAGLSSDDINLGAILPRKQVFAGYPDELVSDLTDRMLESDIGRVPVITRDDGRLAGLVAREDLPKIRARMLTEERERETFFRKPATA